MYTKEAMQSQADDLRKAVEIIESFARMSGRELELLPLANKVSELSQEMAERAQ